MSDTAESESLDKRALLKLVLELGPLVLFFFTNNRFEILTATAVFMFAATVALVLMWLVFRRVAVMPLVSTVVVLVFGGLTLWFSDELFIKLKRCTAKLHS